MLYDGVRIIDMPDLGPVHDGAWFVGDHQGSGKFSATALLAYIGITDSTAGLVTSVAGRTGNVVLSLADITDWAAMFAYLMQQNALLAARITQIESNYIKTD
jgi:hypothetical protein